MLKAIDFFCGAGGMTQGLLRAGIDVLAGIDSHLPCKEAYETNNVRASGERSKFIQADVKDLDFATLASETGIAKNEAGLVFVGCSPCQYWSKINTDRTKSKLSKALIGRFGEFVEEFRPGYVVIENVPGLWKGKAESGLSRFISILKRTGYHYDCGVVKAYEYGVPQKRQRFLLLATRVVGELGLPRPEKVSLEKYDGVRVRDHIGIENGFAKIKAGHRDATTFLHTAFSLSPQNLLRIQRTPRNGGSRSAWKDDPSLQLNAYVGKDDSFRDVYGRMSWDEPAPTITTRFVSLSNGRFGHPAEDRAISLREGATLQTFPRDYIFKGSLDEVARQIGNAVPPELARRVGAHLNDHWIASSQDTRHG